MADDGIAFDGLTAEEGPLGGAETAFAALAEALAQRGHDVTVWNRCRAALCHKNVRWAPLSGEIPTACDLYIGNRGHRVIGLVEKAGRRVFWLHNPAGYLKKPRNLWRLAFYRPVLVTTGAYHSTTVPWWLPRAGCEEIPYGVLDRFRLAAPREPPLPRIAPVLPQAELHIYAGRAVYGMTDASRMEGVLKRADSLTTYGVRRFAPIGRARLAEALLGARTMLYRGDPGETFCLALAEAQAMGVPVVVQPLGSAPERVVDGVTGCVATTDDAFCAAAIAALRDDVLWEKWHRAALVHQRGLSWDEVATRFEALMQ
jgi:hypothetical protein